jgi:acetyl/propionyl-CoA carboxylase alpha subunit
VASGEPLPWRQEDVVQRGAAIDCRIYAEDPAKGFLPSPGPISRLEVPQGPGVRVECGVAEGVQVSVHYDPLLAKLVTWGADRMEAVERMAAALRRTVVLGVTTNHALLRAVIDHRAFREGDLHTAFVDEHLAGARLQPCPPAEALAAAVAALHRARPAAEARRRAPDPWASLGPWRLGGPS